MAPWHYHYRDGQDLVYTGFSSYTPREAQEAGDYSYPDEALVSMETNDYYLPEAVSRMGADTTGGDVFDSFNGAHLEHHNDLQLPAEIRAALAAAAAAFTGYDATADVAATVPQALPPAQNVLELQQPRPVHGHQLAVEFDIENVPEYPPQPGRRLQPTQPVRAPLVRPGAPFLSLPGMATVSPANIPAIASHEIEREKYVKRIEQIGTVMRQYHEGEISEAQMRENARGLSIAWMIGR